MPPTTFDWCASAPEKGDGLAPIQFHPSLSPARPAPSGTRSSTHTRSDGDGWVEDLPALSHVARPPKSVNAMPFRPLFDPVSGFDVSQRSIGLADQMTLFLSMRPP